MKARAIMFAVVLVGAGLLAFALRGGNSNRWKQAFEGGVFSTSPLPQGSQLRIETRVVGEIEYVLLSIRKEQTDGKVAIAGLHKFKANTVGAAETYVVPVEGICSLKVLNYTRSSDVGRDLVSASDSVETTTLRFAGGGELVVTLRQNWRTGELNREVAKDILNAHLARPFVNVIKFRGDGFEKAIKDKAIISQSGFPPTYAFTDPKVASVVRDNRIALAAFGIDAPKFYLRQPLGEQVNEIRGIAFGPNENIREVEYLADYLMPDELRSVWPYIFVGDKTTTTLRRYDDGWRVAK